MVTYYKALIEAIEDSPVITWTDLTDRFKGRHRDILRGALVRNHRHDLVTRVDRQTGTTPPVGYSPELVRVIETNKGISWEQLSSMFEGRSKETLKGTLYYVGRNDLIKEVQ